MPFLESCNTYQKAGIPFFLVLRSLWIQSDGDCEQKLAAGTVFFPDVLPFFCMNIFKPHFQEGL